MGKISLIEKLAYTVLTAYQMCVALLRLSPMLNGLAWM